MGNVPPYFYREFCKACNRLRTFSKDDGCTLCAEKAREILKRLDELHTQHPEVADEET